MRSNSYTTEEGALHGVNTFKELAGEKSNFDVDKTDQGNIMFELKAKNNMTVATSIVFESQTAVKEALRYIISNAKSASIEHQRPIPQFKVKYRISLAISWKNVILRALVL